MLTWNVYVGDFNNSRIVTDNVFDNSGVMEDLRKAVKKFPEKEDFAEAVRKSLMYHYWSKCEWEIILSNWPPSERMREEKIDVYDQVRLNWPVFIDYLWENRKELTKRRKKDGRAEET